MKHFLIVSLCTLIPFLGINAQGNSPSNQTDKRSELIAKYMEEKISYLKQCIALSDSEAERFFTLYDEMEKKKFEVMSEVHRESRKIRKSTEVIADEVYAEVADKLTELPMKIAQIESEYFAKFREILTPKQMFMFFNCEHNYGKSMLKKGQNK